MTSSIGRFGMASGTGEKMVIPIGNCKVATRGGWTAGGNGRGGGKRIHSLIEGQVAALGLQVFPQKTPSVMQRVVWGEHNVMVHSVGGDLLLLQVQALGLQVFLQKAPAMQ